MPDPLGPRGRLERLLKAGDVGRVLVAVEDIVETVVNEPLNTAEIFGDEGLDAACQEVGRVRLKRLRGGSMAVAPTGSADTLVFIASRLQSSGGHTAVLADIARRARKPVTVLLTGVGGPTNLSSIQGIFGGVESLRFEKAPKGDRLAKLDWLQERLMAIKPVRVWLLNHHQDAVAVAAVQPAQGYALNYVHHGDHHLCLGVHLGFGEHYDLHPMGVYNCRNVLHLCGNRYLPLVVPDVDISPRPDVTKDGPLITCTAAGSNKIEHAYWPGYAEVVAALLAQTGGTHIHIGRLSRLYRWRIRRALTAAGVDVAAFRYIPHVKSVALALRELRVDLYLASFPYAGARTLVEVMAAGIPTAGHDHSGKRFLGAIDMLPPGSCAWSRPEQLIEFLSQVDRSSLKARGGLARRHYESYHSPAKLDEALAEPSAALEIPVSKFQHDPDLLAQAYERVRQASFGYVAMKWLKKNARRLRSRLS